MRSIKDFEANRKMQGGDGDVKSDTAALAAKYEGKSESELMRELMKNVSEAKDNGTFSASQLDEFVGFVSPSLDDSSRARLNELVKMIKGG